MKEKFLFLLLVSVVLLVLAVSCSDEEGGGEVEANVNCNSNIDCDRDSYCDFDHPKQDPELGMLVYSCKKRKLCATQADCPINWKCKENEGFCITSKEADGILCKSNDDCKDPEYPICNLANGECRSYDGDISDGDKPWESDDEDHSDTETDDDPEVNDSEPADKDNDVSDNDADTDTDNSSDPGLGQTIMTEDFEDGGSQWTRVPATEGTHCWDIGIPTSGPEEAHGGANVAATALDGNYLANCKDLLYYNTSISIPSEGKPEISFYAWVDIVGNGYSPYDYVEVIVKKSEDVWELTDTGVPLSAGTPSVLDALDNHKTKITKQLKTNYYKFTGDLSAFKGKSVDIGFRFTSDESDEAFGFYLDDITVSY
ncbi:choice-of-anchor J domain-containing protein [bacterium]|nr:choice-of-anchor J domain-containing protein [bacterium]